MRKDFASEKGIDGQLACLLGPGYSLTAAAESPTPAGQQSPQRKIRLNACLLNEYMRQGLPHSPHLLLRVDSP